VDQRAGLIVIASSSFRRDPAGLFLPLMRDYADTFKRFHIHATGGTARSILSTGIYRCNDLRIGEPYDKDPDVIVHRYGREGGVVEVAALVPNKICNTVMFFSDPSDPIAEVPENRALQRVCKELGKRLISTLESARQWLEYEAESEAKKIPSAARPPPPATVKSNVDRETGAVCSLALEEQTLALIAHDRRKEDMAYFVSRHGEFLQRFARILTTGTTGWTLKILFGTRDALATTLEGASIDLGEDRMLDLMDGITKLLQRNSRAPRSQELLSEVTKWRKPTVVSAQDAEFASRVRSVVEKASAPLLANELQKHIDRLGLVRPLEGLARIIATVPSGPKGGDIILANEVLEHHCHASVFFQDPQSAHAHDPDIRLFERTCHFWTDEPRYRVHISCVSDPLSAHRWASALSSLPANAIPSLSVEERLRRVSDFGLRDVVLVDGLLEGASADDEAQVLPALVKTAGRYMLQEIHRQESRGRPGRRDIVVAVGHGMTVRAVMEWLRDELSHDTTLSGAGLGRRMKCLPIVGNVSTYSVQLQATRIAQMFADGVGGDTGSFRSPGVVEAAEYIHLPPQDTDLIERLRGAAPILVVGGGPERAKSAQPETADRDPVGIVSSFVLDRDGMEIQQPNRTVGIGIEGLEAAARQGNVVFICVGKRRRALLRAMLFHRRVSVLITDRSSAEWVVGEAEVPRDTTL
jgi:methylglyoxal synthase/DNA-binding transcriptional regulator LsrR (DeoR family)